jgi:hypothetical protein
MRSSTQLYFRYPGRRLLNRQREIAVKTEVMSSVESMTVALHDQSSSKDTGERSNITMLPTAVRHAMTTSRQSIIAIRLTGSDTTLAAKNLKFSRDSSANMSRGKNSAVSHHKSDDNILMTANDTLGGHVDATTTPTLTPTRLSIVPAVVNTITEPVNYTPRLCKHLELLSCSEYNSACHDQSTTFLLLDTPYIIHRRFYVHQRRDIETGIHIGSGPHLRSTPPHCRRSPVRVSTVAPKDLIRTSDCKGLLLFSQMLFQESCYLPCVT